VSAASVIGALKAALDAAPEDEAIRRHLADLLVADGRAEEALSLYEESLRSHPDDVELLRAAALAARLCGRLDEAHAHEHTAGIDPPQDVSPPGVGLREPTSTRHEQADPAGVPNVTLADVGGLQHVKARLNSAFLAPAKDPALSSYYGKSLSGGLLLYGPPGCGKTYTARALAGELGAQFHQIGIDDVLDMWLGESERKLHELFSAARRSAPALLFLDEVDALGRKRSQMPGAGRTAVNQLLAELDGINTENDGLFVVAATNHPWDVDTALRRPGRLDRMVFVPPPDADARAQILALHLRDRPTAQLDLVSLAESLNDFSGADLAYVCEGAVELAMEDALRTGDRRPVSQEHLLKAAHDTRPSTRPWFDIAQNVARFAGEGGQYDDMLSYMRAQGML
jgi:SpoVK/Ycf46/Vps4 family AAA+-type ATPase